MTKTNKYQEAVDMAKKLIDPDREPKLQKIQGKIDDLKSRGLLNKQEYKSATTSDIERAYYRSNKVSKNPT